MAPRIARLPLMDGGDFVLWVQQLCLLLRSSGWQVAAERSSQLGCLHALDLGIAWPGQYGSWIHASNIALSLHATNISHIHYLPESFDKGGQAVPVQLCSVGGAQVFLQRLHERSYLKKKKAELDSTWRWIPLLRISHYLICEVVQDSSLVVSVAFAN